MQIAGLRLLFGTRDTVTWSRRIIKDSLEIRNVREINGVRICDKFISIKYYYRQKVARVQNFIISPLLLFQKWCRREKRQLRFFNKNFRPKASSHCIYRSLPVEKRDRPIGSNIFASNVACRRRLRCSNVKWRHFHDFSQIYWFVIFLQSRKINNGIWEHLKLITRDRKLIVLAHWIIKK